MGFRGRQPAAKSHLHSVDGSLVSSCICTTGGWCLPPCLLPTVPFMGYLFGELPRKFYLLIDLPFKMALFLGKK